jgi:hypothetical protein
MLRNVLVEGRRNCDVRGRHNYSICGRHGCSIDERHTCSAGDSHACSIGGRDFHAPTCLIFPAQGQSEPEKNSISIATVLMDREEKTVLICKDKSAKCAEL